MSWQRMLAFFAGSADEESLLRNEFLGTENRILRARIEGGLRLSDPERISLFCESFRAILRAAGVEPLALPPRSPNFNACAERWVRSVKEERLERLILCSEASLRHALAEYAEYLDHFLHERDHRGRENRLLFPRSKDRGGSRAGRVRSVVFSPFRFLGRTTCGRSDHTAVRP